MNAIGNQRRLIWMALLGGCGLTLLYELVSISRQWPPAFAQHLPLWAGKMHEILTVAAFCWWLCLLILATVRRGAANAPPEHRPVLALLLYGLPLVIPWIVAAPSLVASVGFANRWPTEHAFSLNLIRRVVTTVGLVLPTSFAFVWWRRGMSAHLELATALCPELTACANARVAGAAFAQAARRTGAAWAALVWLAAGAAGIVLFLYNTPLLGGPAAPYSVALAISLWLTVSFGILLVFRGRLRRALEPLTACEPPGQNAFSPPAGVRM